MRSASDLLKFVEGDSKTGFFALAEMADLQALEAIAAAVGRPVERLADQCRVMVVSPGINPSGIVAGLEARFACSGR
jgi:hypothetical protein